MDERYTETTYPSRRRGLLRNEKERSNCHCLVLLTPIENTKEKMQRNAGPVGLVKSAAILSDLALESRLHVNTPQVPHGAHEGRVKCI